MWREQTWCGWKLWQAAYSLLFRHPYPSSVSVALTGTSPPCYLLHDCIFYAMAAHSLEVARTLDVSRLVPCGLVHRSRLYSKVVRHSLSVVRSGHTLHASVCLGCNIGFLAVSRPATISGLPSFALHKVMRAPQGPRCYDL